MTDYRAFEIEATELQARAAEVAGWSWFALAVALAFCSGATAPGATSVLLALWACWPLWLAGAAWRRADDDREIAAWMGASC